ncbi:MAG: isoaspartyl peptidase/L-asparaginase [Ktedonobacteraceae bacterium]
MAMAIIVHGGAGHIPAERAEEFQAGCKEAALVGWRILQGGGAALDAVEAAVRALENNPIYNAGTGAGLTNEGNIELDAGMMEGKALRVGAVAGVELIKNPISLARKVMESPHVLLVGKGAQEFAVEQGITVCKFEDLMTEHRYQQWKERQVPEATAGEDEPRYHRREVSSLSRREDEQHGTVGAVALDAAGILAAATSTGGTPNKYPGRVGDSPLVGCGFYADDNAAISCTGYGEDFMRLLLAKRAADIVACGVAARDAAEATIAILKAKATGAGGLIVVDSLGNVGFAWNSEGMSYAYMHEHLAEPVAGV